MFQLPFFQVLVDRPSVLQVVADRRVDVGKRQWIGRMPGCSPIHARSPSATCFPERLTCSAYRLSAPPARATGAIRSRVWRRNASPFGRGRRASRQAGAPGEGIRPCDISQGANNEHRRRNHQHPHNACSYRRPAERRLHSTGARLDARAIASLVERRMGCFGRSLRLYLESNLCQVRRPDVQMMLSTHFSLEELVASEVATRRGLDNTPPNEVMQNYMHTLGLAADILCPAFGAPLEVCRAIARSGILIDQLIHEF